MAGFDRYYDKKAIIILLRKRKKYVINEITLKLEINSFIVPIKG